MKKIYWRSALFIIFGVALGMTSCKNTEQKNSEEQFKIEGVQKKKSSKNPNRKMGIEHMADYVAGLLKPIDAKESTYEEGFLLTEYDKAKKSKSTTSKSLSATFIERGPANVPGRIRDVVVSPANPNKWYAGTVGGGIWVTENAGLSWSSITDFKAPILSTATIGISPAAPQTIYAGTGEPFGNLDALGGVGILKSTDDGTTWTHLTNTKSFGSIGRIAVNPSNADHIVVGAANGAFISTNGGTTWSKTFFGGNVQDVNANPSDFNILYGGVLNYGIIKSIDGGASWTRVLNKADVNTNHSRFELDVFTSNPDKIVVGVYTPNNNATTAVNTDFYISDDAGENFTLLSYSGTPSDGNLITGQGWYDNIIKAHPYNENIFYAGGVVMHKVSIDPTNSFSFQPIAAGYNGELNDYVHVDQHGLTWVTDEANNFRLILSNDGGVYFTEYLPDPGTTVNDWSEAAIGLNSTQFYGADKRNGFDDYIAGAQDNGSHIEFETPTDAATSYVEFLGGDGFEVIWHYKNENKFIAGSQNNNFVRYDNGTFYDARHEDYGSVNSPFYSKITNANNNPDVVFSPSQNGIWKSTNFAETWTLTELPSTFANSASSYLTVAVSTANPDIVWGGMAMTESGSFSLYVSQDNGNTYTETKTYKDTRSSYSHNVNLSNIYASPTEENRAYALFASQGLAKILKTEDLGQTWTDISGHSTGENTGFPDVPVHSMIEMPFDANILWAGTDLGIFQTEDGGATWTILTDIPTVSIWDMKIVNDQVVMATHGRGIWTATIPQLAGYEPPLYFGPPEVVNAYQKSIRSTDAIVEFKVPSSTDNVAAIKAFYNGSEVGSIAGPFDAETIYSIELNDFTEGMKIIELSADSNEGKTSVKAGSEAFSIIDFAIPEELVKVQTFTNDVIFTPNDEFLINNIGGLVSQPILNNNDHPYSNESTYTTLLKKPIIVTDKYEFTYEDATIIEPGPRGGFYDYVTIEASSDLKNWVELDKYDSSRFTEWLTEYNLGANASIRDNLFKEQSINLRDYFNVGDEIVIKLSLVSDQYATSFGWAIKSINANTTLSLEDQIAGNEGLYLYPTIVENKLNLRSGNAIANATISIYDLNGRKILTTSRNLSPKEEQLDVIHIPSGIYILQVKGENGTSITKKFVKK